MNFNVNATQEDLTLLQTLDEKTLLEEIQMRYKGNRIYTYIGDVLLSINPYKDISIYSIRHQREYTDIKIRQALPAHVYAIADNAYQTLRRTRQSQTIVINGESGSGKTQNAKFLTQHIAFVSGGHLDIDELETRIIKANPLLEAFGNAKTIANDNSSRFGKYLEIKFDNDGEMIGALINEYMLEKSRIIRCSPGERNFHIFYHMFAGLYDEQLKNNLLDQPDDHRILHTFDGSRVFADRQSYIYHQSAWDELMRIMTTVGFNEEQIETLIALLAAILHIADIEFAHDVETDGAYILNENCLEVSAEFLGVDAGDLARCFISSSQIVRGEEIVMLKTVPQAEDTRDALAVSLYSRVFAWIVRRINLMLMPERRYATGQTIGILDMAGFEDFNENSFEQLCINTANEELQFFFNFYVFRQELDEYSQEGVKGKTIKYTDNGAILEMLLQKPLGLFDIINEESKIRTATDLTLAEKFNKYFSAKKNIYIKIKSKPLCFTINHYAGPVTYGCGGFLEKNRHTLSHNLLDCLKMSQSQIVSDLYAAKLSSTGSLQMNPDAPMRNRQSVLYKKPPSLNLKNNQSISKKAGKQVKSKMSKGIVQTLDRTTNSKTLSSQFTNSLVELASKLHDSQPTFIRCIKPNSMKQSNKFDIELVRKQLKYTGVMEVIRIRKSGYPTRISHRQFIDLYKIIAFNLTSKVEPTGSNCLKILKATNLHQFEIGKTKVFLKHYHTELLVRKLDDIGWKIVRVQKQARSYLAKKRFKWLVVKAKAEQVELKAFCKSVANISNAKYDIINAHQHHDSLRFHKKAKELEQQRKAQQAQTAQENIYQATPISFALKKEKPKPRPRQITTSKKNQQPRSLSKMKMPPQETNKLLDTILDETLGRYTDIDIGIWAKVYYFERNEVVAKFYVRNREFVINDSDDEYQGRIIGIGCLENDIRDERVRRVRRLFGDGITLSRESDGSISIVRETTCPIIVRGYEYPEFFCLSRDVIENGGELEKNKKTTLFDMDEFKKRIASELEDEDKAGNMEKNLQRMTITRIAINEDTESDLQTPCWLAIINFCALDALGSDRVLKEIRMLIKQPHHKDDAIMKLRNGRMPPALSYFPPDKLTKMRRKRAENERYAVEIGDQLSEKNRFLFKRNWAKVNLRPKEQRQLGLGQDYRELEREEEHVQVLPPHEHVTKKKEWAKQKGGFNY
ncbi:DgyrCDS6862 [Dimorphilus gyrociliatus]|uniref:DgyrCDS6862 n=1 Tax=Dimorphilus gyrociliatus TaxID=2664684 RepID=A0A7I8VP88_9ANNE|nr:DgyrCDS6862 [Dimorphilus gyrociliatus]